MRSRLEEVYTTRVDLDSTILPWLVRHARWLITHIQDKVDGKTPYERLRHRPYLGEVMEFGEATHYKDPDKLGKLEDRWFLGTWLGKSLPSDEHYVGTERGVRRCRSIWRRPGALRWNQKTLDELSGSPWDPQPNSAAAGSPAPRSVYITLDRQIEHGGTKNCPACFGHVKVHSAECRARFEQLLGRGEAAAAGSPADAAGSSAQEPQPETDAAMQVDSVSRGELRARRCDRKHRGRRGQPRAGRCGKPC